MYPITINTLILTRHNYNYMPPHQLITSDLDNSSLACSCCDIKDAFSLEISDSFAFRTFESFETFSPLRRAEEAV